MSYFDAIIDHNSRSFHIVICDTKPKTHESALETLDRIEFIVKNKLTYNSRLYQDYYSTLSQAELFKILGETSSEIYTGYKIKLSTLNMIMKKFFSKEKRITEICIRIENYINPPQVFPLPDELINEITKYFEISTHSSIAQLNRKGNSLAFVEKAREFGYKGQDNNKASKYLKKLLGLVDLIAKRNIFPKRYLVIKNDKFDSEGILQALKGISIEDIFSILSKEELYSLFFKKFRRIFDPKLNWKVTKPISDESKKKRDQALILAVIYDDKSILELLLKLEADPYACNFFHDEILPLYYAVRRGFTGIVEVLLKYDFDHVIKNTGKLNLALGYACGYNSKNFQPNIHMVKLLLQYGADPNISLGNNLTPLEIAVDKGCLEIVQYLIECK